MPWPLVLLVTFCVGAGLGIVAACVAVASDESRDYRHFRLSVDSPLPHRRVVVDVTVPAPLADEQELRWVADGWKVEQR